MSGWRLRSSLNISCSAGALTKILIYLCVLGMVFYCQRAAASAPACHVTGIEEQRPLASFEQLPSEVTKPLIPRFKNWDAEHGQVFSRMAARDEKWSPADNIAPEGPARRFIAGGHRGQRWYLFYEHRGYGGHTYHVAFVDWKTSERNARIIAHLVVPLEYACDAIKMLIDNPGGHGPGLDSGRYW